MPFPTARFWLTFAALAGLLLSAGPASACNIPVFRYALERWKSDPHEAFVFHKGPLTTEQQAAVDVLTKAGSADKDAANVTVTPVDLGDDATPPPLRELYESLKTDTLPLVALRFPAGTGVATPYWSGPLTAENIRAVLQSPARRAIADRVRQGTSGVWLLLESGDRAKDDAAAKLIRAELARLEKELKLPQLTDDPDDRLESGVPLRLQFSLVQVSRADPAESMLVAMLMHTEPDLTEYKGEPMVFALFGQGRALPACLGQGITPENIEADAAYLIGACTCEVKKQNPGFDLLFQAPWESVLADPLVKDRELPPLTGVSNFSPARDDASTTAPEAQPAVTKEPANQTVPEAPTTPLVPAEADQRVEAEHGSEEEAHATAAAQSALLRNSAVGLAVGIVLVAGMYLLARRTVTPRG